MQRSVSIIWVVQQGGLGGAVALLVCVVAAGIDNIPNKDKTVEILSTLWN